MKRIAVTGAAGQIAYSLLMRLANGDLLGREEIALHLLEIPEALNALEGVKMELEDCAFPLLKEIKIGSDPNKVFEGTHYAFLVGAKPRGPGMERKDLLKDNSKIFIEQGKALNNAADPSVKVLVVGNPCNTNAWIALSHAPRIPAHHFHAMTRLDQNRAAAQLAQKAGVGVSTISHMTIWGNHSATQVPDYQHATIQGKPVQDVIKDEKWLKEDFFKIVQQRGAAIIAARGKSSAASAAHAALEAMRDLIVPTPSGQWYSSAFLGKGNPYGIQEDLIFSYPCRTIAEGKYEIVPGLKWDAFLESKIRLTEKELIEERSFL